MCISRPSSPVKLISSLRFPRLGLIRQAGRMFLFATLLLGACESEELPPDQAYAFIKPDHFPDPTYTFDNNPVTEWGFKLGKRLFFDPLLSRDGSVSCNSCHIQATAFADGQQHPLSVGVDNQVGTRNAPSLANLAFMREFFWDGGVTHLDFTPTNAIESEREMDESLANVVKKLNEDPAYPSLFREAFGIDTITSPYLLYAFSQFLVMMVSAESQYDDYAQGKGSALTEEELIGLRLFTEKCSSCHSGELFSDFSYRNNGISENPSDEGRALISEHPADRGTFRVPSLRNVARTAPYMHNARFSSLAQVLNHYARGVIDSPTLDSSLRSDDGLGIPMTEAEQESIITFLQTLSDRKFAMDRRFMNTP